MYIDHIAIWTCDLERLRDFYQSCFGCTVSEIYVNPAKQFASCFLHFGEGAGLELMQRTGMQPGMPGERPGLAHFALHPGNPAAIDLLTKKLAEAGVVVAGDPRVTGDGFYESVVLDPDGNRIELVCRMTPSGGHDETGSLRP